MIKTLIVAGARPNFMKIAPIVRAMDNLGGFDYRIVHTGQHYDHQMSSAFFRDLGIPKPHYSLQTGSGTHAEQTGRTMIEFEKCCADATPDLVLVVGDVNSTLACSIVAKKNKICVAHVEAGLRSFDMTMPEEINRIVTDSISDIYFATEMSAVDNLLREGKPMDRIHFVGQVMIDNLFYKLEKLGSGPGGSAYHRLKSQLGGYIFLTLHRPSNVDDMDVLTGIVQALNDIAIRTPIIFPVHPRTKERLRDFKLILDDNIHRLPPLGFSESLFLWKDAVLVVTDSGGLQEETTALSVPCVTIRNSTGRPITCELGTNRLADNNPGELYRIVQGALKPSPSKSSIPPKWDGNAASRIVQILLGDFAHCVGKTD